MTGPSIPAALPFGEDTVSHRVILEPVVFLGGGRALLLQVAHPLVAAGVADHSDYRNDPWLRLSRTLNVMLKMSFGPPEVSARQRRRLDATHRRVTGTSPDGVAYRALDPDLLIWVWATLVDTALVMYERCYAPLTTADREQFYAEQQQVAAGCGVPPGRCPATWLAFRDYVDEVVGRDLRVTETARQVAAAVTAPALRPPLDRLVGAPLTLITAGLLPPPIREAYGLPWRPGAERRLTRWLRVIGATGAAVPRPVRTIPAKAVVRSRRPLVPPRFVQAGR